MEVTRMIASKLKKIRLFKVLLIACLISLPLFVILTHHYKTAFAETTPQLTVSVTVENLNVRTAASATSQILSVVHKNDQFKVLQVSGDWDQIVLNGNQTGWINNHYIETSKNTSSMSLFEAKVKGLNVHEQADLSSTIMSHISPGRSYKVLAIKGELLQIEVPDGKGWVTSRLVSETHVSGSRSEKTSDQASNQLTVQAFGETSPSLQGKTIVLDAGHGGKDNGTTSRMGTPEKDLTLGTAIKVEQKLESAGAKVIMTRTEDTYSTLQNRVDVAEQSKADAFICFHYNSSPLPFIKGLTSFYYNKSKDQALASDILNEVSTTTGLKNRGARFGNLYVLRNNTQPSTLIELGFVSNTSEDQTVETTTYQEQVADAVYQGLLDYFSSK
jgi:N-acetylmuramoyl-L-alanine amidase